MPINIEKVPDSPILIVYSLPGEGPVIAQMAEVIDEIIQALDEQTEKVYLVNDLHLITLGLDDIIQGATMSARGSNAMMHHPNIRENVYVLTDGLIKMAVKGLASATFGQLKTHAFDTVEEAVAYCREQAETLGL